MYKSFLVIFLFGCIFIQQSTQQTTSCKKSSRLFDECLKDLFGGWLKSLETVNAMKVSSGTILINRDSLFNIRLDSTNFEAVGYANGLIVREVQYNLPAQRKKVVPWRVGSKQDLTLDLVVDIPTMNLKAASYNAIIRWFGSAIPLTGVYNLQINGVTQYIKMGLERTVVDGKTYLSIIGLDHDFSLKTASIGFSDTTVGRDPIIRQFLVEIVTNNALMIFNQAKGQLAGLFGQQIQRMFQSRFTATPEDQIFTE